MDEGTGAESSVKTSSDGADTTSQTSQQSQELTFAWSEETYRLTDVCDADQLPRVVWLEGEDTASINLGLRGYLRQPVLLNHTASKTDCQARTVYRDKTNGKYFEVGQTLIIPDNYEGWFEIVPPSFGRAPYYSNIGEVTKVLPKRFFTRSAIDGVLISRDKDGKESFRERKIPPGAILRTETVFTARWKTQTQSGLFKKKEKQFVTQEIQYLRCRTSDRKEVMVPFQQTGKFHAIYDSDRKEENLYSILRLKDLVKDFQLPLMVRLLYGKAPVVPCIFTGLLMLKSSEKRDTLIGSTVVNKRNVLFELPLDTPCNLKVSADEDQFDSVHSFKDAKRLCKKYAVPYTAMIKLSAELDTNQELVEHKPKGKRESQGESLQTLDLIKDMNIGETLKTESEEGDSASRAESEITEDGNVLELATEEDKKGETVC